MTYTITNNTQFNSLEITFDGKPSEAVREALKALKFRWHGVKRCWYGKATEETVRSAIDAPNTPKSKPAGKKSVETTHGVKVGDLFYTSWGYEQTNVDFFQIVELVGKFSARVREVHPQMIEEDAISGMSSNRKYKLPENGELLPAASSSTFIKDNERGDLRRIVCNEYGTKIKVGIPGHYQETARPYHGETVYVSWYY